MNRIGYILLFVGVIMCQCTSNQVQSEKQQKPKTKNFELPIIPMSISSQEGAMEYMAMHYWDKFDFTDTSYISSNITIQAYQNFLQIIGKTTKETAYKAITHMMKGAEADSAMYAFFYKTSEDGLYDPNSVYRNELLFEAILRNYIDSDIPDSINKIRPKYLLELVSKNQIGDISSDFTYTLESGKTANMHALKSPLLLLYFFNPGCNACKEITTALTNSEVINEAIASKQLSILTVYPDEDRTIWIEEKDLMPKSWIRSYDASHALIDKEIYDLKAIPTLYLLDQDKRVLLKDADFHVAESVIYSLLFNPHNS